MTEFKVSGTGWFCIKVDGHWVAVYKLTASQISEYNAATEAA